MPLAKKTAHAGVVSVVVSQVAVDSHSVQVIAAGVGDASYPLTHGQRTWILVGICGRIRYVCFLYDFLYDSETMVVQGTWSASPSPGSLPY